MIELKMGPVYTYFEGLPEEANSHLYHTLSYLDNANERPEWDLGRELWAGVVRLHDPYERKIWAGMTGYAKEELRKLGHEVTLLTYPFSKSELNLEVDTPPDTLWTAEQELAIEALLPFHRALWEGVPRVGKTYTLARLIARVGLPTLWISHNVTLADQCAKELEDRLNVKVGRLYSGQRKICPVTVAVNLTAANECVKDEEAGRFIREQAKLIVIDEVHRGVTNSHARILKHCLRADRIYGVSGTIKEARKDNRERALRALYGPLVIVTDAKKAEEIGAHVPATCLFVSLPRRDYYDGIPFKQIDQEYLYGNRYMNGLAAQWACALASEGKGVAILVDRITQHAWKIKEELDRRTDYRLLTGATTGEERQRIFKQFEAGEINILLSTVLSEGVNLERLYAVFLVGAGDSMARVVQRMYRPRTASEHKQDALVVDFIHNATRGGGKSTHLHRQALNRLEKARTVPGFDVQVIDYSEVIKTHGLEERMSSRGLYPVTPETDRGAYTVPSTGKRLEIWDILAEEKKRGST